MTDPRTPTSDPVAAAVLRLLAASPEPASPEAPGSGLRPARLASPLDCRHGNWYRDTRDFTWCMDCGRWRDDVMAEVAARPDGAAHRMGPPRWEPGNGQDEWTNRCLACGERWPCAAARPDGAAGTDPVPGLVAGVPQREPVGDVPGQGAVTEPVPADLCGAVMATCRNEPGHDGEHWHPGVRP